MIPPFFGLLRPLQLLTLGTFSWLAFSWVVFAQIPPPNVRLETQTVVGPPSNTNGCWARLYEGHNFQGRALEITGEVRLNQLQLPNGIDWRAETKSIIAGGRAEVVAFTAEDFRGRKLVVAPGTQAFDLPDKIGAREIRSVVVRCLR